MTQLGDLVAKVTFMAATHAIQVLHQYSVEQGFSYVVHAGLDMCSYGVFMKATSKKNEANYFRLICGFRTNLN